jgi:hypothetical protein
MNKILFVMVLFCCIFVVETSNTFAGFSKKEMFQKLDQMEYETKFAVKEVKKLGKKSKDLFLMSISYDNDVVDTCAEKIKNLISIYKKSGADNATFYQEDVDFCNEIYQKINIEIKKILMQISETSNLLKIIDTDKENYFDKKQRGLEEALTNNLLPEY